NIAVASDPSGLMHMVVDGTKLNRVPIAELPMTSTAKTTATLDFPFIWQDPLQAECSSGCWADFTNPFKWDTSVGVPYSLAKENRANNSPYSPAYQNTLQQEQQSGNYLSVFNYPIELNGESYFGSTILAAMDQHTDLVESAVCAPNSQFSWKWRY